MTKITVTRCGTQYRTTINRSHADGGRSGVMCNITRNRAMEIVSQNPDGRFDGSGGFDYLPCNWEWRVEVEDELAMA